MTVALALVVEDNRLDARSLRDLLAQAAGPIETRRVPDLAAACAALRAGSFDVVLLDLRLPDGCGAAAVEQVRSLARGAAVVVLADLADEGMALEALGAGAEAWLVKGHLAPAALARVVRGAAERRAARASGLSASPGARPGVALLGANLLIVEALAATLEAVEAFDVLGSFTVAEGLLAARRQREADLVIVDATGPADPRRPAVGQLHALAGPAKVMLIADATDLHLQAVLDGHVDGILATTSSAQQLVGALHQVLAGQVVLPGGWRTLPERRQAKRPPDELSARQREILALVASGYSNEQIAARLFISANTVKFHLRTAYRTLGVHNRMQAVRLLGGPDAGHPPAGD